MQLTTQMIVKLKTIEQRFNHIKNNVWSPLGREFEELGGTSLKIKTTIGAIIQEFSSYKIVLENMLCETDIKEQDNI